MRVASSSRLYHWQRNNVIDGNRHPSKKPRRRRVTTREANPLTKPVHMHTNPQENVIAGITLLNCSRFTKIDVGN